MKAVVAAFNQEKALVGAFSVLTNLRMDLFQAIEYLNTRYKCQVIPVQMSAMGGDVGFSHHHMGGGQRKYQCKMCPQVGERSRT